MLTSNIAENSVWCVEENATYTIDNDNLRTILFLGDEQQFITSTRRSNPPLHYNTSRSNHSREKSAPQATFVDTIDFIKKMKRWGWIIFYQHENMTNGSNIRKSDTN